MRWITEVCTPSRSISATICASDLPAGFAASGWRAPPSARQAEARAGGQAASEVEDENEISGLLEDVIAALVTLTVRTFLALLRAYRSMFSPGRVPDT